jgi:hypothetical protein
VARSAREKVSAAIALAAAIAVVAAFAVEVGPTIRFWWRLRGLADAKERVRIDTLAWLWEGDPSTLRAHAGALLPALERYVADYLPKERAGVFAYVVLDRWAAGDPALFLRIPRSSVLWPAAYRGIVGLHAPKLLPEEACEATLERAEERASVNLLWGTQDRRYGSGPYTLRFHEGKIEPEGGGEGEGGRGGEGDVLDLFESVGIADLGERPLEGIEAIAENDPGLHSMELCRRGHTYVVLCTQESMNVQIAVQVREYVPGVSAKIAWRVLRAAGR